MKDAGHDFTSHSVSTLVESLTHEMSVPRRRLLVGGLLAPLLSACGGGGSDSSSQSALQSVPDEATRARALAGAVSTEQSAALSSAPYTIPQRMAWWYEARFGMFIHFGSYSYRGRGEWVMNDENWSKDAYQTYVSKPFNPTNFSANSIVSQAKAAGMKYIVITSKHHEGYAMWDSDVASFKDVTGTQQYNLYDYSGYTAQADLLGSLKAECDRQGLRFCLYYSILDWNHPSQTRDGGGTTTMVSMAARSDYISDMKAQLRELIVRYQPAILWFDGDWDTDVATPTVQKWWNKSDGQDLYNFLLALKPDLIVNERVKRDTGIGDFLNPEGFIPNARQSRPWETNETMNGAWGYNAGKESNYQSSQNFVHNLAICVSRDGNLLLNIGPNGLGEVTSGSSTVLAGMGSWMNVNSSSIYGATGTPFDSQPSFGVYTKKAGHLYAHVFSWPSNGVITIAPLLNTVTRAYLLSSPGTALPFTVNADRSITVNIPTDAPDSANSVIAFDLDGEAIAYKSSYLIVNRRSGLVIDVPGAQTEPGTNLIQWTLSGAQNQLWQITNTGGGIYTITSAATGQVIDVFGNRTDDSAGVIEWPSKNTQNQQWRFVAAGGGFIKLISVRSGKPFGPRKDYPDATGTWLEQQTDSGSEYQQWRLA